ncbi:MAG: hypothetical protein ABLQ96_03190, partial [Candidatus Acidiferrum sp.]
ADQMVVGAVIGGQRNDWISHFFSRAWRTGSLEMCGCEERPVSFDANGGRGTRQQWAQKVLFKVQQVWS